MQHQGRILARGVQPCLIGATRTGGAKAEMTLGCHNGPRKETGDTEEGIGKKETGRKEVGEVEKVTLEKGKAKEKDKEPRCQWERACMG